MLASEGIRHRAETKVRNLEKGALEKGDLQKIVRIMQFSWYLGPFHGNWAFFGGPQPVYVTNDVGNGLSA